MVTKEFAINHIKEFVKCCTKDGTNINKVILFGSILSGSNNSDSDIDVLIFSNQFSNNLLENTHFYAKYMWEFYDLDIKAYNTEMFEKGNLLIDEVKKNGLEISIN